MIVGVVAVLVAVTATLVAAASSGTPDQLEVRSTAHRVAAGPVVTRTEHDTSTSTTTTTTPPPVNVTPRVEATVETTLPAPSSPTTTTLAPVISATSSVHVTPSTGLANLDVVTVTATGIPPRSYLVGECLATGSVVETTCAWNGRPQVAFPTDDGTLTASVTVSWFVGTQAIDCGRAPGTCAVGIAPYAPTTGSAPTGVPITFDPGRRPTIAVTSTVDLLDGQTVTVEGHDVGAGVARVQECLVPFPSSCAGIDVPTGSAGAFSASITVHRALRWIGGRTTSGTCGVDGACVVRVVLTPSRPSPFVLPTGNAAPLSFRAEPTTTAPPGTTTTSAPG